MIKEKKDFSNDKDKDKILNIYNKLQQKRALERHLESLKITEKELKAKEFFDKLDELKENFYNLFKEKKDLKEKFDQKELEDLVRQIENEIKKVVSVEELNEIEKIKEFSRRNLFNFIRKRNNLIKNLNEFQKTLEDFKKIVFSKYINEIPTDIYQKISEYEEVVKDINGKLENELPNENFESLCAHYLLKLREYQKQLSSGIIETEYPKIQKQRAKNILLKNRLVAFLGETGIGKTKIARKVAQELTGGYEFIAGHHFMSKEDLFFYLGIDVSKISPEEVPDLIQKAKNRYYQKNPDILEDESQKNKIDKLIEETVKGQVSNPQLITKIFKSGVLKAAEEGKIVIIDEFNYIPSNLLAGINALIEAKPKEKINFLGEEVEVKDGFGIILTGNITKSEFEGRYLQREKIDPALVNRLNSGLIEYASLPQDINLSFLEAKEKGDSVKRELFEIGLAFLADKKGNVAGPINLLEKLWNLSREFSLLQKIYAGEPLSKNIKLPDGKSYILQKYHASNRTFRSIVESWKKDGYVYPIDWYIYDNLIRPASIIAPSEAGKIFILLRERGGFFRDKVWEKIKVDENSYKIFGLEEIEANRVKILDILKNKYEIKYFSPKEIAEAMSGKLAPSLDVDFVEVGKENTKDKIKKHQEMLEKFENIKLLKERFDNFKIFVKDFCEDEKKILKDNS